MRQELSLPDGIYVSRFNYEKILSWWERCRAIRGIGLETVDDFVAWLSSYQTIVLEMDGGAIFLYNLVPGVRCDFLSVVFDGRMAVRTELVRQVLLWAFLSFNLQRIGVWVPSSFTAFVRWAKRLGFKEEGKLRGWNRRGDHAGSVTVMSITCEEAS